MLVPPSSICSHLISANGLALRIQPLNRRPRLKTGMRLEMSLLLDKASWLKSVRQVPTRLTPLRLTATLPTSQGFWRESGGRGVFQRAG